MKCQMKSWYSTEKAFSPIGCGINDKSCRFMIIWRMLDICLTTTWQLSDVSMSIYICFLDSCLITSWQLLDNYLSTDDWHAIVKTCLTTWRLLYNFKADFEKKTTRQIRVRWWQCYVQTMLTIFPDFWHPPPPCRQFFSTYS